MNNHLGRVGTYDLTLFSLNYISLAFTQCCPSSVSPSICLRWSPSWTTTSNSTSVACELAYHGRRRVLTGLEAAKLSITELKIVSANAAPVSKSDTLASFAEEFSSTFAFLHFLSHYFFLCEFANVTVDPLSGACLLQHSTSAALSSASVEGITCQLVASTMSPSTAWWRGENSPTAAFCLDLIKSFYPLGLC